MKNAFLQSKAPGIIVSEICMVASACNGTPFLLESLDDGKFWHHFVNLENVTLVNCGDKINWI